MCPCVSLSVRVSVCVCVRVSMCHPVCVSVYVEKYVLVVDNIEVLVVFLLQKQNRVCYRVQYKHIQQLLKQCLMRERTEFLHKFTKRNEELRLQWHLNLARSSAAILLKSPLSN